MGLVGYSDSEGSDGEAGPVVAPVATKPTTRAPKAGFQKVIDPSALRKIKVDLPTAKPDVKEEEERPAKKARTGGFGGFNSFLPAPKRAAEKKSGLGVGVSLRTGAEPAFSRERPEPAMPAVEEPKNNNTEAAADHATPVAPVEAGKPKEVKMVGNAMRFKPLSVANKKKKKPTSASSAPTPPVARSQPQAAPVQPAAPPPKKKVSLFSVSQEETVPAGEDTIDEYQPILADSIPEQPAEDFISTPQQHAPTYSDPNSLDAIASDLNLSASARRQLFGRNKDASSAAKIMHFDMETEYASNEQLRQQGLAQEHRAVKAVAPGKHSLQQLVNAASSQKEALEDKWAEGKRNKAEGGSRYGW